MSWLVRETRIIRAKWRRIIERESLAFLHEVAQDPGVAKESKKLMDSIGRYTYSAFAQQSFGLEVPHGASNIVHYIHGK